MADLAVVPLQGQTPRGGRIENFDELAAAEAFADTEKDLWDLVLVYKRIKEGELEKKVQYQKGRKYELLKK
jgi:hypothetical protein